jgi:hypothetical protein
MHDSVVPAFAQVIIAWSLEKRLTKETKTQLVTKLASVAPYVTERLFFTTTGMQLTPVFATAAGMQLTPVY